MYLESKRLIYRKFINSDAEAYFRLSQNTGFRLFQISDYRRSSIEESRQWIEEINSYHHRNGFGIIGVFRKENQELIGLCALKYLAGEGTSPVEIMYRLSDEHWRQNYGIEIGGALVDHAFNKIGLNNLVATVDPQNIASKKILRKLGFEFKKIVKIESYEEELHELSVKKLS